ncbi:FtsX-like permease family protein [Streptomyces sp. NPDC059076]|uniref:FtsX-like permease family protein n=1 Tax=unclassified Streptomyces TaxID=2593676 RepID=UPI0036964687
MILTEQRSDRAPARYHRPGRIRSWLRDLAYGLRFGAFGGREGWLRNALTAAGVGLGVALLLIAASVPQIMDNRDRRAEARTPSGAMVMDPVKSSESAESAPAPAPSAQESTPTATSMVWADASTEYREEVVEGVLLRAEGARPTLPPGIGELPGPGEMLVSPALRELLASDEGRLLADRLDHRVIGTIGDAGLLDPGELFFYAGSSSLATGDGAERTDGWGGPTTQSLPYDPLLVVVITLACVVLLVPVAVFIATAVRFGGDRRDRRLAALRLVGADAPTTRRIAAGEALFGSVLGVLCGVALFALVRQFAGWIRIWELSAFPSDVVPLPELAAALLVSVPVASVLVTLVALRSVVIEPLGVVRRSTPPRRRFWWRPLLPAVGLLLLLNVDGVGDVESPRVVDPLPIALGSILMLLGVAALLPWLVEAVVGRMRGGPLPWQLATRRLQLSSGPPTRAVSGIMVAVAGAIALQMLFAGMHDEFNRMLSKHPGWNQLNVTSDRPSRPLADRMTRELERTEGVREVTTTVRAAVQHPEKNTVTSLTMGNCATLQQLATIDSCEDGDTFVIHSAHSREQNTWVDATARKGSALLLSDGEGKRSPLWTLPRDTRTVVAKDPEDWETIGVFATFGALDVALLPSGTTTAQVSLDGGLPDAREHVRNTAAAIDPGLRIWSIRMIERDARYESLQTGLLAAATATLGLIAASMLVSQIEQLTERRRLLASLVAFGTRRTTLAWSVLWQTAIPVVLGTAVAIAGGLALGAAMLALTGKEVTRWWLFLPVAGVGAAAILLVTLLSLPPLWRMMRPDGLRTE